MGVSSIVLASNDLLSRCFLFSFRTVLDKIMLSGGEEDIFLSAKEEVVGKEAIEYRLVVCGCCCGCCLCWSNWLYFCRNRWSLESSMFSTEVDLIVLHDELRNLRVRSIVS